MKPNPRAGGRPPPTPAFLAMRAVAVVGLFVALARVLWSLLPQASSPQTDVAATAPATSAAVYRRRPVVRHTEAPSAALHPMAGAGEHRREDESKVHEAFATAAAIDDSTLREETLARLCYHLAESDPRGALDLAILHGLEGSGGVIGNLAQQWAAIDLPAALAWIEEQPESALREDVVGRVGYVWSLEDPAAAAGFVARETPAGETQEEAAISVLHQWNSREPAAARAWGECFPPGQLRDRALEELGVSPTHDE